MSGHNSGFDDINIPYIETDRKQAIEYALKNMKEMMHY